MAKIGVFGANFGVNWQKLAKNGVLWCKFRCKLAEIGEKLAKIGVLGVNFILQKFCLCKKMTNIRYARHMTCSGALMGWGGVPLLDYW